MLVGPFQSYEDLGGGRYRLKIRVLRPKAVGEYIEDEITVLSSPGDRLVEKDGKIYLETSNPWLQTLGLNARLIPPRVSGNTVENVVPVATIERTVGRHRFYGYYIVFDNGKPVDIRGAGIYERIVPEGMEDKEPAIPANLVKDITELGKDEFIELARHTPVDLLPILHRIGRRDIVAANVAEMLRSNPLAVKHYPRNIIEKYLVEQQDMIVRLALLENTPIMMKILIEELRSLGYDADKVSYIYMRYYEEKQEDKQLERMKKQEEKQMSRHRKNIEEEQERFIKEYEPYIKEVIGVTVPIILATPLLGGATEKTERPTRKTAEEAAEEVEA